MKESTGRSRWKLVQNAFEFREQGTHPIEKWKFLQGIFNFSALESKRNRQCKNSPVISWGTPEQVAELNTSVKDCLRIEGLNPDHYFTQESSKFASVVEYYLDLHQCLAKQDIDLFVSLSGRLGGDHPLVKGMKEAMDRPEYKGAPYDKELLITPLQATPETRTPRTSTSTVMRNQETQTEEDLTPAMNGSTRLGTENRISSWVVGTNSVQPPEGQSPTDEANVQTNTNGVPQEGLNVEPRALVVNDPTPSVEREGSVEQVEPLAPMPSRIWNGFKKRFCLHP